MYRLHLIFRRRGPPRRLLILLIVVVVLLLQKFYQFLSLQSSAFCLQLSVASRQSLVISYQLPVISCQSLVPSLQSSVDNCQSLVVRPLDLKVFKSLSLSQHSLSNFVILTRCLWDEQHFQPCFPYYYMSQSLKTLFITVSLFLKIYDFRIAQNYGTYT